jgi:type IV pilus assembly protein PilV
MNRHFQIGVSLIEILVAIIVLAVGILGLTGMQLTATKYNKEASLRSVATLTAVEIADRMRSNIAGVKAGSYNRDKSYADALTAVGAPSCGSTSDCTAATMADLDINAWQQSLAALPGGAGAIVPAATTAFSKNIVVMWMDKSLNDAAATDPACPKTQAAVGVRCFNTTFIP